jgi:acetyl esterase/lipase
MTARAALLSLSLALAAASPAAVAQERLARWRAAHAADAASELDDGAAGDRAARLPGSVRALRDAAYGPDAAQRLDVYLPAGAPAGGPPRPVVFFVHGGGWAHGDKAMSRVVEPKVAHWVERGWVVVSTNYRMLPVPVATQLEDVAAALAFAQAHAASWGADPARFVLMGHSAGAHLVALLAAGAPVAAAPRPWRGAVLLDSAALDVPALMRQRHLPLYDHAFGTDPALWERLSPFSQLTHASAPLLAVCSSRRRESCPRAEAFVAKDLRLGARSSVLREDLSHGEINMTLGEPSDYTAQVDAFLDSLR